MRKWKLRSVNWQGALKQKGMKQRGIKQGHNVFKMALLSNLRMDQSFLYSACRYCECVHNHSSLGCEYTPKDERTWFQSWTWVGRTCGRSVQWPDRYDSSRRHHLVSCYAQVISRRGGGVQELRVCVIEGVVSCHYNKKKLKFL
jgi:hypothetical protein